MAIKPPFISCGSDNKFSESAKLVLFVNAVVQFLLFFDGVLSYGGTHGVRQLELPQRGIGVLVASDETDAAANGATSISFNLEFSRQSRSAEIYLLDNIGRVPGFYDQTYKQKVGVRLRRSQAFSNNNNNVTINAYYQWPSANIRGWSEDVGNADAVFAGNRSIWVDIAIDRRSHPSPLPAVQIYDAGRQTVLFTANFNGRADYSLRPKVEYRVISDLPFSVGSVLSFIGQDTARAWNDEYARNYSITTTLIVPTIHLNEDDSAEEDTTTKGPIVIQFPDYKDSEISGGTKKESDYTTPAKSQATNAASSSKKAVAAPAPPSTVYDNWLPPPTWLLITSGCLLFFLFIVFTGTVLYLCSRRPGFIFVTEEDANQQINQNNNQNGDASSRSLTPSVSPRPYPAQLHHHLNNSNNSDDAHGSTSPMMPGSAGGADSLDDDELLHNNSSSSNNNNNNHPRSLLLAPPLPPHPPSKPPLVYRYQQPAPPLASQDTTMANNRTMMTQRSGFIVTAAYSDGPAAVVKNNSNNNDDIYETEALPPRRQQVLTFAPTTRR